jgi:hypothetical protein
MTAGRPGEIVKIDSTPPDVMVMLDDGIAGRVELTGMIDLATRTITAAVLRPTTKSVDASLLLAWTVTPEPMRPGWAEALSMGRSVLPHARLLELDQTTPARCRQARNRPGDGNWWLRGVHRYSRFRIQTRVNQPQTGGR